MNEAVQLIPIGKIDESKTNPRKFFDPESEKDLLASIGTKGIIEPLRLRPAGSRFELVDGARRFRAAKAGDLQEVPAIVRPYTDDEVVEIQLISFTQKVGIHPLDEADAYARLLATGLDVKAIASKVGKPRPYIEKRIRLAVLVAPAKKLLRDGKLPLGHAIEIARLGKAQQEAALEIWKDDEQSLDSFRNEIQQSILLNLNSAPFTTADANLVPEMGACTVCPKRTGANPDLFGDISKMGNHCLDPNCWEEKIAAANEQKRKHLEDTGVKIIEISTDYYRDGKSKALLRQAYEIVPEKNAKQWGEIVDGDNPGKIVPIRLSGSTAKKDTSEGGKKAEPSPARKKELYKRRLEIFENRVEQEARLHQFKSLLMRLKWPIERKDFDIILLELMKKSRFDSERIAGAIGLQDLPDPGFEHKAEMKNLSKLTDQQVAQAALGIVLDQELIADPLQHIPGDGRIASISAHHGIDRKKIHDDVAKEMEPKKPKPPKIEPPAKKAKAKKPAKKKSKK